MSLTLQGNHFIQWYQDQADLGCNCLQQLQAKYVQWNLKAEQDNIFPMTCACHSIRGWNRKAVAKLSIMGWVQCKIRICCKHLLLKYQRVHSNIGRNVTCSRYEVLKDIFKVTFSTVTKNACAITATSITRWTTVVFPVTNKYVIYQVINIPQHKHLLLHQ